MFIAVDLKVVEGLAAAVGRAGGMSEDAVLAGLVRLWHRCWADEADLFTGDEISGLFAFDASLPNGSARALAALVAFGFLELKGDHWRVRGAARYLRLKESRRRGAQKTNEARSKSVALERHSKAQLSVARERSSTEHTESPRKSSVADIEPSPPKKRERRPSAGEEFFGWLTATRGKKTPLSESNPGPRCLNTVFGKALTEVGRPELERRYLAYLNDPDWGSKSPPWPWEGFAKRWRWLHPRGVNPQSESLAL